MALAIAVISGCASYPPPLPISKNHIQAEPQAKASGIPEPVKTSVFVPPPKASLKPQTYSVVVNEVPVKELLFALARDSGRNIDVYPTIRGVVTLNAIDETLDAILDRIVKQVDDLRYEVDGNVIRVMPDTPYLQTYRVNYVNIERETTMESSVDSTVAKTGSVGTGGGSSGSGNSLSAKIKTTSKSKFWELLVKNVEQLLRDSDKQVPLDSVQTLAKEFASQNMSGSTTASGSGSAGFNVGGQGGTKVQGSGNTVAGNQGSGAAGSGDQSVQSDAVANQQKSLQAGLQRYQFRERASVIANPETGMLAVRATKRQHQAMQEFLKGVLEVARRQVLIEATIVEVELNNSYQGGIDWSRLGSASGMTQSMLGQFGIVNNTNNFTFNYATSTRLGSINATVKLLETFGDIKVLSSPKLMALNNQTAVLQAVDNQIYFTVKVTPGTLSTNGTTLTPTTYETDPHTVAEGVVMTVTPQINENGRVGLTIRPTISRIVGYAKDPNPDLAKAGVTNQVPILQVRTMESVLQVSSGQILVMGGLMQERAARNWDGVPVLARLPSIGDLFKFRDDASKKSELVVFLRPTVIEDNSSAEQELMSNYKHYLPQSPVSSLAKP
jgi:general secretion pathway protein D